MAKQFTQEEIKLLFNTTLSARDLCNIFKVKTNQTIGRWRKQLGVSVAIGSKKGKPRPFIGQYKRIQYQCAMCNVCFEDVPSRKRKICSRKCSNVFNKNMDKSYMQTEEYKNTVRKPHTSEYLKYKREVHKLSQLTYKNNIEAINPYRLPRTLAGIIGGYQLDHIIPVKEGFINNIPTSVLSHVSNLRMLPWTENLKRNRKEG